MKSYIFKCICEFEYLLRYSIYNNSMRSLSMCICYAFVLHCSSRTTGEDSDIHQQLKAEQFNCSLFSSSFSRRDNLKRHIYNKIGEIKSIRKKETGASFTCNICDGKFSRKDNLKRHTMRTHETVFKDDRCIDVWTMCNFPGCMESFFRRDFFYRKRLFIKNYNFIDINANTAQLTQEVEITLTCFRNFGITYINVISTPCVRCVGYICKMVVFVEFCPLALLVL